MCGLCGIGLADAELMLEAADEPLQIAKTDGSEAEPASGDVGLDNPLSRPEDNKSACQSSLIGFLSRLIARPDLASNH